MSRVYMKVALRITGLVSGLFLFSLGIVITMKANIGYAPWDVFHYGSSLLRFEAAAVRHETLTDTITAFRAGKAGW